MKVFTDVMNIYINVHTMTNLSIDNYQNWASGEHKSKHIDTKIHTLVQTSMLPLSYMPEQYCNDVSSIHYAMLWIIIYLFTPLRSSPPVGIYTELYSSMVYTVASWVFVGHRFSWAAFQALFLAHEAKSRSWHMFINISLVLPVVWLKC